MKKFLFFLLFLNILLFADNKVDFLVVGDDFTSVNNSIKKSMENLSSDEKKEVNNLLKKVMSDIVEITKEDFIEDIENDRFNKDNYNYSVKENIVNFLSGRHISEINYIYSVYLETKNPNLLKIKVSKYDKNKKIYGSNIDDFTNSLLKNTKELNSIDKNILDIVLKKGLKESIKLSSENNSSIKEEFLHKFNNKTIEELINMLKEEK